MVVASTRIVAMEVPTEFADGLNVGCETKRGLKGVHGQVFIGAVSRDPLRREME